MRKATRRSGQRAIAAAAVVVAGLGTCSTAGAASLFPQRDQFTGATDAVYVAGSEANHVTLSGQGGRLYVFQDPNVPITTPAFQPPFVDTDPNHLPQVLIGELPIRAWFSCLAPRGRAQALCVATPGTVCNDSGCFTRTDVRFRYAILGLGGGNDAVTLLGAISPVSVFTSTGNDTVDSRNGGADYIDCGDGADTVSADFRDNVQPSCEAVTRATRLG